MPQRQYKPSISSPRRAWPGFVVALAFLHSTHFAHGVEALSVQELVAHCQHIEAQPEGVDAQYCIRYIQGFIDGAIATDGRVMLNVEEDAEREETFTERAIRTRSPSGTERDQATQLAGFCLGDPLPLGEIVDQVVTDLVAFDSDETVTSPARYAVYGSLRQQYPCEK